MISVNMHHPDTVKAEYFGKSKGPEFITLTISSKSGDVDIFLTREQADMFAVIIKQALTTAIENRGLSGEYNLSATYSSCEE